MNFEHKREGPEGCAPGMGHNNPTANGDIAPKRTAVRKRVFIKLLGSAHRANSLSVQAAQCSTWNILTPLFFMGVRGDWLYFQKTIIHFLEMGDRNGPQCSTWNIRTSSLPPGWFSCRRKEPRSHALLVLKSPLLPPLPLFLLPQPGLSWPEVCRLA